MNRLQHFLSRRLIGFLCSVLPCLALARAVAQDNDRPEWTYTQRLSKQFPDSAFLLLKEMPPLFLGTKTPYHPQQQEYTPAPGDYHPIFINYVGRHGARFLTKAGTEARILQLLSAAQKSHSLTPLGQRVMAMTVRLQAIEKDNYENITLLGQEEQRAIGERMAYNYREVFAGKGMELVMTYKVRTQQSAGALLQAFAEYPGKKRSKVMTDSQDAVLRFYDLSPAYQSYKKSAALRRAVDSLNKDPRTTAMAKNIWGRIFSPGYLAERGASGAAPGSGEGDAVSFAESLYDLYCVQFSTVGEMQQKGFTRDSLDLGVAFGEKDLEWLDFKNGAEDFLEKGPAADAGGIQVKIAAPLLADFIGSMDAVIQGRDSSDAILRFTHAEAISPFAALLGIPTASIPAASIYRYHSNWQAGSVIPLSANIQWILYSDGKHYLVKVLLNEKEVALPLPSALYPYYRWEDVESYYSGKLQSLHLSAREDMRTFLLGLK